MRCLALFVTAAVFSGTVAAHHSVPATFDVSKEINYKGTIENIAWMNPHVTLSLKVDTPDGKGETWTFELPSPGGVLRVGLSQDSLKPGVQVSFSAFAAKNGNHLASAVRLTLGDRTYDVKDNWGPAETLKEYQRLTTK